MASGKQDFMDAIKNGDADFVRTYLCRSPGDLNEKIGWGNYDGYPINYAAFCDQPGIIRILVTEFGADPNRNDNVGNNWTPLHHAKENKAFKAAAALLELGANPARKRQDGETSEDFCKSREVEKYRDPSYHEKQAELSRQALQQRIDGSWSRTGAREVTHDYELPDLGCRLKDIFNFETRCLRSFVRNNDGQGITQNFVFFDDMPDQEILRAPGRAAAQPRRRR